MMLDILNKKVYNMNRACLLSIVFRKIVSGKMKFCAGRSGEGAAKHRLGASEHAPAVLSRVPRQRHSSE